MRHKLNVKYVNIMYQVRKNAFTDPPNKTMFYVF